MAFTVGQLSFNIGANTGDLDKAIRNAFGGVLKQAAALTAGFLGAQKAVSAISSTLSESVRAAAEADKGMQELSAALARAGVQDATRAAESFAAFAGELQNATGISDDAAVAAAKIGASFGLSGDRLEAATKAAADLSTVMGVDLGTAMRMIATSAAGGSSQLGRLGIKIGEGVPQAQKLDAILVQLSEKFGGAAAAAVQTYSGRVALLSENWGDAHEELGRAITQNETVNAVLVVASQQVQQLGKWIASNRATMSEWVTKGWGAVVTAAQIFVGAMEFAGKAIAAFKVVGNLAIAGVVEIFNALVLAVEATIGGLGALASFAGMDRIAAGINTARGAIAEFRAGVEGTRDTFLSTANDGSKMWEAVGAGADAARAKIAAIDTQVKATAATIGTAMPQAAAVVVAATTQTLAQAHSTLFARLGQTISEGNAAILEANLKLNAQLEESNNEMWVRQRDMALTAVTAISDAFGGLFQAWAEGTATARENLASFLGAVISSAERVITAYAAQAAAAAASWAGILGPIAMAVAASAAFGLVRGFIAKLPKAADGGVVTGGVAGRDSVPILAMPGEMILPVETTRALMSASRRTAGGRAAAGGMVPSGPRSGGGQQIVFQVQLFEEATQEQIQRMLLRFGKEIVPLQRRGLFPAV